MRSLHPHTPLIRTQYQVPILQTQKNFRNPGIHSRCRIRPDRGVFRDTSHKIRHTSHAPLHQRGIPLPEYPSEIPLIIRENLPQNFKAVTIRCQRQHDRRQATRFQKVIIQFQKPEVPLRRNIRHRRANHFCKMLLPDRLQEFGKAKRPHKNPIHPSHRISLILAEQARQRRSR